MKLSKESIAILNSTTLNKVEAKIIGEFSGHDVDLLPGQIFEEPFKRGRTFAFVKSSHAFSTILGSNFVFHRYTVVRRTPKSYMVRYKETVVYCVSQTSNTIYLFQFVSDRLQHPNPHRVFPLYRNRYFNYKLFHALLRSHEIRFLEHITLQDIWGDFCFDYVLDLHDFHFESKLINTSEPIIFSHLNSN